MQWQTRSAAKAKDPLGIAALAHRPELDRKLLRNTYREKPVRMNSDVLDPFLYHLNDEEHRLIRHMIARTMVDFRYSEESLESALEMEEEIFEDLRSVLVKAGCSEEWIANCAAQACRYLAMRVSRLPRDPK